MKTNHVFVLCASPFYGQNVGTIDSGRVCACAVDQCFDTEMVSSNRELLPASYLWPRNFVCLEDVNIDREEGWPIAIGIISRWWTYTLCAFPFNPQAATLKPYLSAVRSTLTAAMCLENFESQVVERHNKPEVEVR